MVCDSLTKHDEAIQNNACFLTDLLLIPTQVRYNSHLLLKLKPRSQFGYPENCV